MKKYFKHSVASLVLFFAVSLEVSAREAKEIIGDDVILEKTQVVEGNVIIIFASDIVQDDIILFAGGKDGVVIEDVLLMLMAGGIIEDVLIL